MVAAAETPKGLWHKQIVGLLVELEKRYNNKSSKKATREVPRRFLHPLSATKFLSFLRIPS